MPCPPHEELIAYAAGDLAPTERDRLAGHLDGGCAACAREIEAVAELRRIAADALVDPPAAVLARARRIPEASRARSLGALAGKVAALVFDTVRDPLPLGARASAVHARQMLFRALDYDIDVRVAPAGADRVRVSGQILPGPERPLDAVAGIEIALSAEDAPSAVAETNELGEFDFGPRDEGDYTLAVEAREERLLVASLPARRA
jgi:hypothetical protein